MKEEIVNFIDNNQLESGIIFIIIGVTLLIYKLKKKEAITFKDSNVISWKGHIYLLAIIVMSFIFGLILIF